MTGQCTALGCALTEVDKLRYGCHTAGVLCGAADVAGPHTNVQHCINTDALILTVVTVSFCLLRMMRSMLHVRCWLPPMW